jgi:hypothetical protein
VGRIGTGPKNETEEFRKVYFIAVKVGERGMHEAPRMRSENDIERATATSAGASVLFAITEDSKRSRMPMDWMDAACSELVGHKMKSCMARENARFGMKIDNQEPISTTFEAKLSVFNPVVRL